MKKILSEFLMGLLLGTTLPALAQSQPATQPEPLTEEAITTTATVEKVSPTFRLLRLKDPNGNTVLLRFGPNAPDLSQFHKGDQVVASYYRETAVMLAKPGQVPTGRMQEQYAIAPEDKNQPGGMVVNTIQAAATVENIDPQKRQVVLKEPDGSTVKVTVDKQVQNLDQIKPGDKVVVRYTEAAAISLAKPRSS
jgi:hypothetical protein